ncbi:MAG: HAMP domain-containing histidine kinase [Phycisphaerales bacterium]|nr:HAMP domain-containing histidine kinase [Phycisphaerales bacterium]
MMSGPKTQHGSKRISLANKCLIVFGCANAFILACALAVPWFRTYTVVREYQLEVASQLADAWLEARFTHTSELPDDAMSQTFSGLDIVLVPVDDINPSPFITAATQAFRNDPSLIEYVATTREEDRELYTYARAIRASKLRSLRDPAVSSFKPGAIDPEIADPLKAILVVLRTTHFGESQLQLSRTYIAMTWLIAAMLAVIIFYFILTKLIFSPVRRLRDTTERVSSGDITARSTIRTGDEFEVLSTNFNAMLDQVEETQSRLRSLNENLDLKVAELAEANVGLWESMNFKTEFLANVSHELRTPLNSIIGFAELLFSTAKDDLAADPKRERYLANILTSGRSLLELINDLLDMAKIEAGRMEINLEPVSLTDLLEGLTGIMSPQAQAKSIQFNHQIEGDLPAVETDPGKLQQILYNFLSNAIKFTPNEGSVTVAARQIGNTVRLSVTDTGPGIAQDMQDLIFEKFRQADASHTREFTGTGLGLAICRELADMLQAEVGVESSPGQGAEFTVTIPVQFTPKKSPSLMG